MCIQKVNDFSTDIKDILNLLDEDTIFISGWDKAPEILNIDNEIIDKIVNQKQHINTYIMSKDMKEIKEIISNNFINEGGYSIQNKFTVVSNGTSASFIAILELMRKGINNFLFIGPIYFTYYHLMKIFNKNMYYYDINLFGDDIINFDTLFSHISKDNCDCIIIILPFFGSGISLNNSEVQKLIDYCNQNKIYLIIDYIYGNMDWNKNITMHNYQLIENVLSSKYCIIYESIPKRIFLNGIKNAIIYSNDSLISDINRDSEICQGSISYIQESLLDVIYKSPYENLMIKTIGEAIEYAHNNYELIKTLLHNTDLLVCNSNSGYFTLIGIPIQCFNSSIDLEIVKELKKECGILAIPHSRYYYRLNNYFCFRINLSLETSTLMNSIKKLFHFYKNRF